MKLRIGSLIITLSCIIACNSTKHEEVPPTCYSPQINETYNDSIVLINKRHNDSIAKANEEKKINDSILKSKKKKKKPYLPKPTCYIDNTIEKNI